MSKLVRLHPRHPQLGYVLKSYTITTPQNLRFVEERGWYEVDDEVADELKDIPQQERYPNGPKAFLIASTKEEAQELEEKAADILHKSRRTEKVGTAAEPVAATARPGAKKRATVAASDDDEGAAQPRTRTRRA